MSTIERNVHLYIYILYNYIYIVTVFTPMYRGGGTKKKNFWTNGSWPAASPDSPADCSERVARSAPPERFGWRHGWGMGISIIKNERTPWQCMKQLHVSTCLWSKVTCFKVGSQAHTDISRLGGLNPLLFVDENPMSPKSLGLHAFLTLTFPRSNIDPEHNPAQEQNK